MCVLFAILHFIIYNNTLETLNMKKKQTWEKKNVYIKLNVIYHFALFSDDGIYVSTMLCAMFNGPYNLQIIVIHGRSEKKKIETRRISEN